MVRQNWPLWSVFFIILSDFRLCTCLALSLLRIRDDVVVSKTLYRNCAPDRYFLMVGLALPSVGQIWARGICSSNVLLMQPVHGRAARSYKSLLWPEYSKVLNSRLTLVNAAVRPLLRSRMLCTPWNHYFGSNADAGSGKRNGLTTCCLAAHSSLPFL